MFSITTSDCLTNSLNVDLPILFFKSKRIERLFPFCTMKLLPIKSSESSLSSPPILAQSPKLGFSILITFAPSKLN